MAAPPELTDSEPLSEMTDEELDVFVSERLGHSTTAITNDTYAHVTPTMGVDAAERVANLIFGV